MGEENSTNPIVNDAPKQTRVDLFRAHLRRAPSLFARAYALLTRALAVLPRRRLAYAVATAFGILTLVYVANFYRSQSLAFSYADQTCLTLPAFLPSKEARSKSGSFRIEPVPTVRFGEYIVYSHRACITPETPPSPNTQDEITMKLPGLLPFGKKVSITSGLYPDLKFTEKHAGRISTKDKLQFRLSIADRVFGYRLRAEDKTADCSRDGLLLLCDLPKLGLAQNTTYMLAIERQFEKKPVGTAFKQVVQTVEPIHVINATIAPGQTVYNAPSDIVLTLNKPATSTDEVVLKTTTTPEQIIPIETVLSGTNLQVKFKQPLPRNVPLALSIADATSEDGGYLNAPYLLQFNTSGGPKLTNVNIGAYRVSSGQTIILTLDSNLAPGQNLPQYIKVESGGNISATVTGSGNQIIIRPASLGSCAGFTVRMLDGLKNEHGISGGSAWQYNSRITCQQPFSIGASVAGRGITGYRYGSGANKLVYVGGTHGNERSSVTILQRWMDQLEAQAHRIPARTSIIVIPNLNPDGYAANLRTNANNVDLNRNFPANNWKSGVTLPDKSFSPTGGGTAALSEPESKAIADYLVAQQPRLVLTYHAAGNYAIPNDSGDSVAIAKQYANKSSVYFASNAQTATIFEYDTTGAMEDWLHDKHGITTVLIELLSHTSNDYYNHENALWWTAGL